MRVAYGRRHSAGPVHTCRVWTRAARRPRPYARRMDAGAQHARSVRLAYGRRHSACPSCQPASPRRWPRSRQQTARPSHPGLRPSRRRWSRVWRSMSPRAARKGQLSPSDVATGALGSSRQSARALQRPQSIPLRVHLLLKSLARGTTPRGNDVNKWMLTERKCFNDSFWRPARIILHRLLSRGDRRCPQPVVGRLDICNSQYASSSVCPYGDFASDNHVSILLAAIDSRQHHALFRH